MKRFYPLFFLLLLSGCSAPSPEWSDKPEYTKYENVVSVFINKPTEYMLLIQDGNEIKPIYASLPKEEDRKYGEIKVLIDTPNNKPIWAEKMKYICKNYADVIQYGDNSVPKYKTLWLIHIHKHGEINGGEWNEQIPSGKSTRTETGKVIEIQK